MVGPPCIETKDAQLSIGLDEDKAIETHYTSLGIALAGLSFGPEKGLCDSRNRNVIAENADYVNVSLVHLEALFLLIVSPTYEGN